MTERDKKIIELYQIGKSAKEISNIVGFSVGTVFRVLRLNKIPKQKNGYNLTKEDKQKICDLYQNYQSVLSISKQYNVSASVISQILLENNIILNTRSKIINPSLKEDYFQCIDTPEKAYWLGWLISDGCIVNNKIQFNILQEDKYILHQLEKDLNVTNKVKISSNGYARFSLGSIKMCQDLTNYNITPKKTFTVTIPENLDKTLYSHLIRGIFDGDGSISVYTRTNGVVNYEFSITGNKQVIEKIKDILECEIPHLKRKTIEKNGSSIYRIRWGSKKDIILLRDYLYKNSTNHYLIRKYEKIIKLC